VDALRATPVLAPGLAERTARRGKRQAARRRLAISSMSLSIAALAVVAIMRPPQDDGYVTFDLVAPSSAGVSLVGDFTDWETDRVRLEPTGDNRWEVKLKLPPGRYRFAYVTDEGNWIADADAPPALDDFGGPTSMITVSSE
jgi:1,4-alpha-glucan branching enzyme